jgi:acetyltransferase-like isoleucine patch superfamily enzyme
MLYENKSKNIRIEAGDLQIGTNVTFGENINIKVRDKFYLGDYSHLGNHVSMKGENICIGKHFYYSPLNNLGINVGGGGADSPNANLTVGDRCVFHNSLINICEPVTIGDDVGLSNHVDIITHGFWYSALEGYPLQFKGVNIGNNVIVGWKSVIMSGVDIANNTVIGSCSNVVKSLTTERAVYGGNPAKLIKKLEMPNTSNQIQILDDILYDFSDLLDNYDIEMPTLDIKFPYVTVNNFKINVDSFEYEGQEDELTDAFRDFLRKRGIRIYTNRGFNFKLKRK